MASDAQIAANRLNAQKSTGPKTPEGKTAARRNALRHGLQSQVLSFNEEDNVKLDALLDDLLEEHQPVGPTEELVFCKLVEQYWLSRRGAARLSAQTRCPDQEQDRPQIALICRYNTAATNGFYRALRELDRLQTRRKSQQPAMTVASPLPAPEPEPETQPEAESQPPIGFVPQNVPQPSSSFEIPHLDPQHRRFNHPGEVPGKAA